MGCYSFYFSTSVTGSDDDKERFKKLLALMLAKNDSGMFDSLQETVEEIMENGVSDDEGSLYYGNALLGPLELWPANDRYPDRYGPKDLIQGLDFAPKLFAALIPDISFRHYLSVSSDNGGFDDYIFEADYKDHKLVFRKTDDNEAFYKYSVDEICEMLEIDKNKVLEAYYEQNSGNSIDETDLKYLIDLEYNSYKLRRQALKASEYVVTPERNPKYEKSFYAEKDILERINENWTDEDWGIED